LSLRSYSDTARIIAASKLLWLLMYLSADALGAFRYRVSFLSVALRGLTHTLYSPRGRESFSETKHFSQACDIIFYKSLRSSFASIGLLFLTLFKTDLSCSIVIVKDSSACNFSNDFWNKFKPSSVKNEFKLNNASEVNV